MPTIIGLDGCSAGWVSASKNLKTSNGSKIITINSTCYEKSTLALKIELNHINQIIEL